MSRHRIVIDTNVLISAAIRPDGTQAQVIHLVAFRAVEMVISEAVMVEYREVFSRPRFSSRTDPAEVSRLLSMIEAEATMVRPTEELNISEHASDNRIYECAAAAEADYIVTGNTRHFARGYKKTKIITGRQLLELLAAGKL